VRPLARGRTVASIALGDADVRHEPISSRVAGVEVLESYADLGECSELSSLSEDSLKRNHRNLIVQLSERRLGMKRKHALSLGKPLTV
jgi:hypothetical protein